MILMISLVLTLLNCNLIKQNIRVKHGKTSRYAEKVLGIEETDYKMLKKSELTRDQTEELYNYAKDRTIIFSAPLMRKVQMS